MGLIVKNTTSADIFHVNTGINFPLNSVTTLTLSDQLNFSDAQTFGLVGSGAFVINNGASDIVDSAQAWAFMTGDQAKTVNVQSIPAFASKTIGAKKLYKRVVGIKSAVSISADTTITWTCTFDWVKFIAIEIVGGEIGDSVSLKILDTASGTYSTYPNAPLNQFGFDANIAKDFYIQKSEFDADVYVGLQIQINYTSVSGKTVGINFVMNEVKS